MRVPGSELALPEFRARSQSLILRIWCEELGQGRTEWRGQIQHAITREVRYFRGWAGLIACLEEMLSCVSPEGR
jgi:hypothetical protein